MAEETTYLITTEDGVYRFCCPESWKVTFGPLYPGAQRGWGADPSGGLYLRFYEAKDKQRAVFANVLSFRPEHLTLERLETVEDEDHRTFERDEDGTERASRGRRQRSEFRPVNPL